MKILAIHNYHRKGSASGDDQVFKSETALLEQHGNQVLRYTVSNDAFDHHSPLGKVADTLGMLWSWKSYKEVREICEKEQPDIVHVHGCWSPQCVWVQKWSQAKGYKVILTPHGMLEPWIIKRNYWIKKLPALMLYQKKAIRKADYIHATAESEKENLIQLGYNDKIKVIPNAVNVDSIIMKNSWQRTKTILFLSRIHEKKGLNFLIEATAILKNTLS